MQSVDAYKQNRKLYRKLPPHVPRRVLHISSKNLQWFGDSMYIKKGFTGVYKFIQVLYYYYENCVNTVIL